MKKDNFIKINDNFTDKYEELFKKRDFLGSHFGSKSTYRNENPNNEVYFNSSVCMKGSEYDYVIYHGDIDVTIANGRLQNICNDIGETIYIIHEYPSFQNSRISEISKNQMKIYSPSKKYEKEYTKEEYEFKLEDLKRELIEYDKDSSYGPLELFEYTIREEGLIKKISSLEVIIENY